MQPLTLSASLNYYNHSITETLKDIQKCSMLNIPSIQMYTFKIMQYTIPLWT